MTEQTKEKPPIKQEILDLSLRIEKSLELNEETNVVSQKSSIYEETAKEVGLTQEDIGKVKNFESGFVTATTRAIGRIGISAMEKNPEVKRVMGEVPMYEGDSFRVSVDRSSIGRNPKTGESVTSYGSVKTEFVQTTGVNKGQMSKVRSELRELGEAALNKTK